MHRIIEGAADWRGPDVAAATDWIHNFTPAEIAEIDAALKTAKARGKTFDTLTADGFGKAVAFTSMTAPRYRCPI